jgi:hypothetical protein
LLILFFLHVLTVAQEGKAEKLKENLTNVKNILKRKLTLDCVSQEKSELVRLSVSTNSPVRTKDEDLGKLCNKSMRMRSKRMTLAHISLYSKFLIGGQNQGRGFRQAQQQKHAHAQ